MASFKFDELVHSYDQVFKLGKALAYNFMLNARSNKVIVNIADQFATNNNCGFNLANFKTSFVKDFFEDVVMDYERSFIGSFVTALFDSIGENSEFEVFFAISKFEGNMGYSLTETPASALSSHNSMEKKNEVLVASEETAQDGG